MTVLPVVVPVDHQLQCVVVDDAVDEEEVEPQNLSSASDPPWCRISKWLPHHYANTSLLSYATQWKNQQLPHLQMKDHGYSKKRKVTSTKPLTVFGLAFGDSGCDHADGDHSNQRPGPYLIACTSHGEIVVWDMYCQYSSPTKDGATRSNGPTPFRRSTTPWSLIGHEDDHGDDKKHQDHDDIPWQMKEPDSAAPDRINNINTRNEENQRNRPMLRLRLQYRDKYNKNENDIVLYHCHMATIQNHSYYVVCGDHGVSVLDWHQDILPLLLTKGSTDNNDTTVAPQTVPFRHYRTYPTMLVRNNHNNNKTLWRGCHGMTTGTTTKTSPTYYAEVNHAIIVAANDGRRFLYGAANDAFACYKWNLETGQIVATYTTTPCSNSLSYMNPAYYTLALFHNATETELLMGGENGQLQIWDIETDQYLDAVNVNDMVTVTAKGNSVTSNSNNNNLSNHGIHNKDQNRARSITTGSTVMNGSSSATPPQQSYISACTVWNEQWWIVGGGCLHCNSSPLPLPSYHGFIAIIHGTTRSVLSFITTRYKVQQLSLYTEYSTTASDRSNSSEGQSLMALTNTNYMYRWTNPLALTDAAASQKVWCHTPSGYAMATATIDPANAMTAVSGVGSEIDIYLGDAQPYMKLSTNS